LHLVRVLVFHQAAVVARQSHQEEDGGDVLKAVDPLFPLGTLPPYIEYPVYSIVDGECRLDDPGCLVSASKNVRVGWLVSRIKEAVKVGKEAVGWNAGIVSFSLPSRLSSNEERPH
jgi:hypothetical protein